MPDSMHFIGAILIILVLFIMATTWVHSILPRIATLSSDDHHDDITKMSRQPCYAIDYEDGLIIPEQ